jgi:hypothetical protein
MKRDEHLDASRTGAPSNGVVSGEIIDRLTGPYADTLRRHKAEGFDATKHLAEIRAEATAWPT